MAFLATFPEVGQERERQEVHSNGVALRGRASDSLKCCEQKWVLQQHRVWYI